MDQLLNQLKLPTERIEQPFAHACVAGFFGSVTLYLGLVPLEPSGVYEVQHMVERNTTTMPSRLQTQGTLNFCERVARQKELFRAIEAQLRIVVPVVKITATFKDGVIVGPFVVTERQVELAPVKT